MFQGLKDRLAATFVFSGIAIGGVSGMEMVIGGGFDNFTPSILAPAPNHAPSLSFTPIDTSTWSPAAQVEPIAHWVREQMPFDPPAPAGREQIEQTLLGGAGPAREEPTESGDDLYREIAALYARSEDLVEQVSGHNSDHQERADQTASAAAPPVASAEAAQSTAPMDGGPEATDVEAASPTSETPEAPNLGEEGKLGADEFEPGRGE